MGFQVDSFAELFRRLDGAGVGSRIRIANGEALLVVGGLGEHTSQLDLPRMGGLTVRLAWAAYSFLLDHRHSGPIHFHIENRNRLAEDSRKIQLDRFVALLALTPSDILSNSFCGALHRLGSHLQPGQNFHLLAAMIEGSILAHQGLYTAHPGRELCVARYPVPHRPETGLDDSLSTSSRDERLAPGLQPSEWTWNVIPDNGRADHKRSQSPAPLRSPGLAIAAVRFTRPSPHGAWPHARLFLLPPDPDIRSCADH